MRKNSTYIFLAVFGSVLTTAFAFFSFPTTHAQTTNRNQQIKTPTPTPAVKPAMTPTVVKPVATPAVAAPKGAPTATPTPAEDDGGIIRIETEVVTLNVRVVDRNNHPVNNLNQSEFKIYEDNAVQTIDTFSKAEVPTNYALVIDNSGSLRSQLDKVIEASKIIVNTNRPADNTSVIRFVSSDKIEITQDFTSKKADVNEALDNLFIEGGPTAIIDAVYLAAEKVDEFDRSRNSTDNKRRALILVSDGEDRDSYYKEQQLFNLLREADVQIYTVGFVNELDKEGGFVSKSPQAKAKSLLERLASETGGKSYFPNSVSELNDIAKDIANELRTQYSISYYPSKDAQDGAFHNIKVVVNDGPDKQKRIAITRTGRTATSDSTNGGKPTLQNTRPNVP